MDGLDLDQNLEPYIHIGGLASNSSFFPIFQTGSLVSRTC